MCVLLGSLSTGWPRIVSVRHNRLFLIDTTGCHWSLCVCVCVRPPDQCFGCHVWPAASPYKTEASCHYSLVSLSSQGSALLCYNPDHSPLTSCRPGSGFLVRWAGPAAARRQLALRTRQTPADGGPRTRHAKYLSSRRRHMKYSSMVCIRFYSTNLLKSLLQNICSFPAQCLLFYSLTILQW